MTYRVCLKHSQESEYGCPHCEIEQLQKECDKVRGELERVSEEAKKLRRQLNDLSISDAWVWIGDGNDDLNSMGEDMIIKIRAEDLRSLLSEARKIWHLGLHNIYRE
jgi:hypothetical protein